MSVAVAAFMIAYVFAPTAAAQDSTDEDEGGGATDTQQDQVFAEGEQAAQVQANVDQPGPLAGTEVETRSTGQDLEVETIIIPRTDCTFEQGASFVLQDDDGTQADFIDNVNVKIKLINGRLEAVSNNPGGHNDIKPLNERGGDRVLDTGGLVIVTSTGIGCTAVAPPPSNPPPSSPPASSPSPSSPPASSPSPSSPPATSSPPANSPPASSPPASSPPASSPPASSPAAGSASPVPEPQDVEKGPLAGGTAIGKDVLVPGDVIDILPDGTRVNGIDQIIIETENCELTAQGNDLTITMSDRGVPFRIRDGDNADITLESDGTIVANGRSTLGESFPEAARDNPDKLIVPIPVDPENDQFPRGPNDTFPILSSTGVGGEGCRVVGNSRDGGGDAGQVDRGASIDDTITNAGDLNSKDGVIPDTISNNAVPNTSGMPMFGPVVSGLVFVGVGLLLFRSAVRRNT
jgi:hypothetical protein